MKTVMTTMMMMMRMLLKKKKKKREMMKKRKTNPEAELEEMNWNETGPEDWKQRRKAAEQRLWEWFVAQLSREEQEQEQKKVIP